MSTVADDREASGNQGCIDKFIFLTWRQKIHILKCFNHLVQMNFWNLLLNIFKRKNQIKKNKLNLRGRNFEDFPDPNYFLDIL